MENRIPSHIISARRYIQCRLRRFDSGPLRPLDISDSEKPAMSMKRFINSKIPINELKEHGIHNQILFVDFIPGEESSLEKNINNIIEESYDNNARTLLICTKNTHVTPVIVYNRKVIMPLPPSNNGHTLASALQTYCQKNGTKLYIHPNLLGVSPKSNPLEVTNISDFLSCLAIKTTLEQDFDKMSATHYQADAHSCAELAHQTLLNLCKNKNSLLNQSLCIEIPQDIRKDTTMHDFINSHRLNKPSIQLFLPMPDVVIPWSQSKEAIMGYRFCLERLMKLFHKPDTQDRYTTIKNMCQYFDNNIIRLLEQRQQNGVEYKGQIYGKEGLRRQRQERMQTINSQNVTP